MRYSNFVGRVGALAVALGIGAAVTSSPVVAWADSETEGASSSERTTSTKTSSPSAQRDDRNVAHNDDSRDVGDDNDAQNADDDADLAPTDSGHSGDDVRDSDELSDGSGADDDPVESTDIEADDRHDSRAAEPDEAPDDRPATSDEGDVQADSFAVEVPAETDRAPATFTTPAAVTDVTVAVVDDAPVEKPEAIGVTSVTSLLSSVLAPFGASDDEMPPAS